MAKSFKYVGKLVECIREKSSRNGNPRYTLVIALPHGQVHTTTTAPDSGHAYGVTNYQGKMVVVESAIVRGRMTLREIEKVEISQTGRFIAAEFNALPDNPETVKIQVRTTTERGQLGSTKWLSIPPEKLEALKELLIY